MTEPATEAAGQRAGGEAFDPAKSMKQVLKVVTGTGFITG
jgi:hypothetical protein